MGWRESITLPGLRLGPVLAKVDTGANTAALHALRVEIEEDGEGRRVRFHAVVDETRGRTRQCVLPLHGVKRIKNSGGAVETRYVVETEIELGTHRWTSLFTLTDRADMGYPVLLGRATIRGRFLVNPGRSHLLSRPPAARRAASAQERAP